MTVTTAQCFRMAPHLRYSSPAPVRLKIGAPDRWGQKSCPQCSDLLKYGIYLSSPQAHQIPIYASNPIPTPGCFQLKTAIRTRLEKYGRTRHTLLLSLPCLFGGRPASSPLPTSTSLESRVRTESKHENADRSNVHATSEDVHLVRTFCGDRCSLAASFQFISKGPSQIQINARQTRQTHMFAFMSSIQKLHILIGQLGN